MVSDLDALNDPKHLIMWWTSSGRMIDVSARYKTEWIWTSERKEMMGRERESL